MPKHGPIRNPHNIQGQREFNPNLSSGRTPANGTRRGGRGRGKRAQQRTPQQRRTGSGTSAGLLRGQPAPQRDRTKGVRRLPTAGRAPAINRNITQQPQRLPRSRTSKPNGINRQSSRNGNVGMMGGTYVIANSNIQYDGPMVEFGGIKYTTTGSTLEGGSQALVLQSEIGRG